MYCEPSRAANEIRIQAEHAALSFGSTEVAIANRLWYCTDSVWLGCDLSSVSKVIIHASNASSSQVSAFN